PEQLEVACKEGLAAHLEHDLRHAGAPRVDATARAGGGDHADARKPHGRPSIVAASLACNRGQCRSRVVDAPRVAAALRRRRRRGRRGHGGRPHLPARPPPRLAGARGRLVRRLPVPLEPVVGAREPPRPPHEPVPNHLPLLPPGRPAAVPHLLVLARSDEPPAPGRARAGPGPQPGRPRRARRDGAGGRAPRPRGHGGPLGGHRRWVGGGADAVGRMVSPRALPRLRLPHRAPALGLVAPPAPAASRRRRPRDRAPRRPRLRLAGVRRHGARPPGPRLALPAPPPAGPPPARGAPPPAPGGAGAAGGGGPPSFWRLPPPRPPPPPLAPAGSPPPPPPATPDVGRLGVPGRPRRTSLARAPRPRVLGCPLSRHRASPPCRGGSRLRAPAGPLLPARDRAPRPHGARTAASRALPTHPDAPP